MGYDAGVTEESERVLRIARRATLPGRKGGLELERAPYDIEGPPDLGLARMHQLTLLAWRLAGRELPSYARSDAPGRVLRPGTGKP